MNLTLYTNDLLKVRKRGKGRAQNESQEAWWPQNQRRQQDDEWVGLRPSLTPRERPLQNGGGSGVSNAPAPSVHLPPSSSGHPGWSGGRGVEAQRSCPRDR